MHLSTPDRHFRRNLIAASLVAAVAAAPRAFAQTSPSVEQRAPAVIDLDDVAEDPGTTRRAIDGGALGGFVLPSKPIEGGLSMQAMRGYRWKSDDTQRLFLDGDVRITLGGYSFSAKRALVWINRLPLRGSGVGGETASQVAIWFERAEEPTRRAGLGASGRNLLVTGTYLGSTGLSVVIDDKGMPKEAAFVRAGESRLAMYLRQLTKDIASGTARLSAQPSLDVPAVIEERMPTPGGNLRETVLVGPPLPSSITLPAQTEEVEPIFRPEGTVSFSADSVVIDEHADRVAIQGMVEIEYLGEVAGQERALQLSAERGVIFLAPGALASLRNGLRSIDAGSITGIYLEGAVHASDGDYGLRGAQVYYDLTNNRAVIVDAVLRTYNRLLRDTPIYTRAAELRQVAADQWTADRASVSTSEFFTPHLSIGVDRVTVTKQPDMQGGSVYVSAAGAGLEVGGMRVLPLPGYEGNVERIPLRSIEAGYDQDRGAEFGTDWDLMALTGAKPVEGLDAELSVDAFSARGAAIGTTFKLSRDLGSGVIDLYGLYDTGGNDLTSAGLDVDVAAGGRGVVDAEWQTALSSNFNLQTQLAYLSDETFASAWLQGDYNNRREYESSFYINGVSDNTALTLLAKYDMNDFISNSYLLASRGYTIDKVPELAYRRYGDNLFDGVTWTQQWSANMMQLRPTTGTPNSLGVPIGAWGNAITPTQSITDAYYDAGYRDDFVTRLDTRHEVSVPLSNDWVTVTPFVSGEATGYMFDEFNEYALAVDSDAEDVSNLRFQAATGVRSSMRFVYVDDAVQSRVLDLNRMRHILEPYGTLWAGYDSNEEGALPIYDQDYEGTTGGAAANIGVRNTLQTQRGGSGSWQSVDWMRLDAGFVFSDNSSDFTPTAVDPSDHNASLHWAQSPIPAFYSFRPELSQWGSHAYGLLAWQLSDALTLGGTANYLFEDREFVTEDGSVLPNLARGSLGLEMRHSPIVSTYIEYRYIAPTESELLQAGFLYRAGKRYLIACSPQYDLRVGDMRAISGVITRNFPDFDLSANAGYDLIEDNTFVGLSLSIPANSQMSVNSGTFGSYTPTMGSMQ